METESPAARAGIRPGDVITAIDGHRLRDVIDYQFHAESAIQRFELMRDGSSISLEVDSRELPYPGIVFRDTLFDGVRRCRCNCVFCFVDQLPDALRPSLYLKDDDFRLSFLHGNFITLGNLDDDDIGRIKEQRLSPLYVSVHATDAAVRAALMGCSRRLAAAGLEKLSRLGAAGIETHIQVVLCPGVNDGDVLDRTLDALANDFPGVASVGIVPVAVDARFSAEVDGAPLRQLTIPECRQVVADIGTRQETYRRKRGHGFVYAADELYLRGGLPLPELESYDGLPQYENGIGIVAAFRRDAQELLRTGLEQVAVDARVFLLTGALARDQVQAVLDEIFETPPEWLGSRTLHVLTAGNRLFGEHVTVTGLLGGGDVLAAAESAGLAAGDALLMPSGVLDSAGERFLDDLALDEFAARMPGPVIVV